MRLGIVGMLPRDFRKLTVGDLQAIRNLGFTGAAGHFPGDLVEEVTREEAKRCRELLSSEDIDLVQFSITYPDCLFSPDKEVRDQISSRIERGAEISSWLGASVFLIRTGSLNSAGSYAPHRDNHTPEAMDRLIQTLKSIAPTLESENLTCVLETHAVTILDSPETCRDIVESVGSDNLRIVMDFVNHFESLRQVYASRERITHIFDTMGALSPVCHVKDIAVRNGLVIHLDETVPGEGELDVAHALQCFDRTFPDGYALIEHLKPDLIPQAAANVRKICLEAGIQIH